MSACRSPWSRWTPKQHALLLGMAGAEPVKVILVALGKVGPPRTRVAVHEYARTHGIRSLKVRKPPPQPSRSWSPEQEAALAEMAGRYSPEAISERVSDLGRPRSPKAVKDRAQALGISLERVGLTASEIQRILATNSRTIKTWLDDGELASEALNTGPRRPRIVQPAELERFIRSRPWLFDWRRMQPGRWRDFVRATQLAVPTLNLVAAGRYLGVCDSTVSLWARLGLIPGAERIEGRRTWRVPYRSLEHLASMLERPLTDRRQIMAEARAEQGR